MTEPAASTEGAPGRRSTVLRIALGGLLLAVLVVVARQAGGYIPQFAMWIDGLGVWGPLVFAVGYAIATVAFVPGSLLTLAGGAVFGLGFGTVYVFIGASVGATASFLIARYFARSAIERKLAGNERFAAIDRAVGDQGRKIVFLLRLSPVFPFILLNYGLGLTKVRLADYIVACLGMLPGTLLYTYYGKVVGDVAALAAGAAPERGAAQWALLGVGLLATVVVTTVVTRIAARALKEATKD
jgi:uncharacterized membrane protein YdjX (TVP38/TMEM64 family)